jgi:hypothetical protein
MSRIIFVSRPESRRATNRVLGENSLIGKAAQTNALFTTRPPFPWNMLMQAARKIEDCLILREKQIEINMGNFLNNRYVPDCQLLTGKSQSEFYRTNVGHCTVDIIKDRSSEKFIDWLAATLVSKHENNLDYYQRVIRSNARDFRKNPVYSFMKNGNADISYYAAHHIQEQLIELIIMAKQHRENHKLAIASSIFGHFLSIHPFRDGNGRAARRLLELVIRKLGLWCDAPLPLGHLARLDRKNYIQSLRGLTINGSYDRFLEYSSLWITASSDLALLKKMQ